MHPTRGRAHGSTAEATEPEFVTTADEASRELRRSVRKDFEGSPDGFLVPPISHASGAFPGSDGPESTPSLKTARKRPPTGGFRNAADLRMTDCSSDLAKG
jgi:hypothetical protein